MKKRILIVMTSNERLLNDRQTGVWFGTLIEFFDFFIKVGFQVDMVSLKGGNVPLSLNSLRMGNMNIIKSYLNDIEFMNKLRNIPSISTVNYQEYDCIYLCGGHGASIDFPYDQGLQQVLSCAYEDGMIVAAVSHGTAGLLNVKLSNGDYLVKGKMLCTFTNIEEKLVLTHDNMPFLLEDEFIKRDAKVLMSEIPISSFVVADKNLITGQNPLSVYELAKKTLEAIKQKYFKV